MLGYWNHLSSGMKKCVCFYAEQWTLMKYGKWICEKLLWNEHCEACCIAMMRLPIFLYLFRPSDGTGLSVKKLIHLLAPAFDEGSNSRKHQKEVYNAFIRYIREVSAGQRVVGSFNITLGHILQFVCGTDEEPLLGFAKSPGILFVPVDIAFLPTANTCKYSQSTKPQCNYHSSLRWSTF